MDRRHAVLPGGGRRGGDDGGRSHLPRPAEPAKREMYLGHSQRLSCPSSLGRTLDVVQRKAYHFPVKAHRDAARNHLFGVLTLMFRPERI